MLLSGLLNLVTFSIATSIFAGPRQATVLLNRRRASLEEANVENLETLLRNLGLEKYYPIFKSNGIELNQFASLSDQELKDLVTQSCVPSKP